jgi:lactoylglutathione lyase
MKPFANCTLGGAFVTVPQSRQAWGIRTDHFRDPEGNLPEIFSRLHS